MGINACCILTMFFFSLPAAQMRQAEKPVTAAVPIAVDIPVQEWLSDYLDWTHHHPGVIKQDSSGSPQALTLPMPYVELFSPAGFSLFRGGDDKRNAVFIESLKREIPNHASELGASEKPTLREYFVMLDELKPYKDKVFDGKRFTLFAVTYLRNPMCKAQNQALFELENHTEIQVIQLNLVHS